MSPRCAALHSSRSRPRTWVATGAVWLGLVTGTVVPVMALEVPVFGPKEYVRTRRVPDVLTETFTACAAQRTGWLRVENGPQELPNAARATVTLNGIHVIHLGELNRRVELIERPVTIQEKNRLVLRLGGRSSGAIAVSIVSETPCQEIVLASPAPGVEVPAGSLTVRGSVTGFGEAGVTVNGYPARVSGETFAAVIPVHPAVTELIAVATAPDGVAIEARQPLAVTEAAEPAVLLHATPAAGVSPLTVSFGLSSLVPVDQVALDVDGDGTVDFQGTTLEEQTFIYTSPGLYVPTVTVTDADGQRHSVSAVVQVDDLTALDSRLQTRWTAMRGALAAGDVDTAVGTFAQGSREVFRDQLEALASVGALAQVASDLGPINLIRVRDGAAEYDLRTVRDGIEYSFHVLFVIDADGIWRLSSF